MTLPRNLSRYELLEEIGRGNMGVVHKALDRAIDRTVAIKVVRLGFAPNGFESSRHDWRWRWSGGEVRSFERLDATELELVVAERSANEERLHFTFLRPEMSPAARERYQRQRAR